ncbi:Phosphoribosylformylglycinamidine synthase, partial [Lonchura striata]
MAFAGNCGVTVGVPAPPPGVTQAPGPRVAVLREEGSNGDREMAAAFAMAGFQVWDVTTQDLCSDGASLDGFRGLVFVGGFSYGDVLGSAKGEREPKTAKNSQKQPKTSPKPAENSPKNSQKHPKTAKTSPKQPKNSQKLPKTSPKISPKQPK